MKKFATFASAAVLATAAAQSNAFIYGLTGSFDVVATVFGNQLALPFTINSGTYDSLAGTGTWNATADLSGLQFGTITFDQNFTIDAASGLGSLGTAANCTGNSFACSQLGPQFLGPLDANGSLEYPGGLGAQVWSVTTPNFGTVDFQPTLVPVPAAAWLFGSALVGLAGIGRKRKAA